MCTLVQTLQPFLSLSLSVMCGVWGSVPVHACSYMCLTLHDHKRCLTSMFVCLSFVHGQQNATSQHRAGPLSKTAYRQQWTALLRSYGTCACTHMYMQYLVHVLVVHCCVDLMSLFVSTLCVCKLRMSECMQ